jgi:hypothetical protein
VSLRRRSTSYSGKWSPDLRAIEEHFGIDDWEESEQFRVNGFEGVVEDSEGDESL